MSKNTPAWIDSKKYWIWLHSVKGIGSVRFHKLVKYFGSPEEVFKAAVKREKVPTSLVDSMTWSEVCKEEYRKNLPALLAYMCREGISVITTEDEEYPGNLRQIYDPPAVLFYKGKIMPTDNLAVGVVGTRFPSEYGRKVAEGIGYQLARSGITVVSGLARGIDSASHRGALRANGRTVAVLGCGVDKIYPRENRALMNEIINSGAIVSEYLPGTAPQAGNFPPRNRIISGWSLGIVIVEAGRKSGALITADFALEQNREVFAVPGNINNPVSYGTNSLIKQGAKLITCLEDILDELGIECRVGNVTAERRAGNFSEEPMKNVPVPTGHGKGRSATDFTISRQQRGKHEFHRVTLSPEEDSILELFSEEPVPMDYLLEKTGWSVSTVSFLLTMLEIKGLIRQTPGNRFALVE